MSKASKKLSAAVAEAQICVADASLGRYLANADWQDAHLGLKIAQRTFDRADEAVEYRGHQLELAQAKLADLLTED